MTPISHCLRYGIKNALHWRYGVLKKGRSRQSVRMPLPSIYDDKSRNLLKNKNF
jgi:hypothetical protein